MTFEEFAYECGWEINPTEQAEGIDERELGNPVG